MFLTNPFYGAFGLDIGDLSIKLVCLRHRTNMRGQCFFDVEQIRTVNLPPGLIVNGELEQPETVRKKLMYMLGKEGSLKPVKTPWVVASLPELKTFLKLIEVEAGDNELTSVDINYHAKKHLPYELEETYIDWQVVNSATATAPAQVLIGAAPKIIADSYIYLLDSVGLSPVALEIEAVSLARALITVRKDYVGEARALLDLGATRSSVIIFDNNSIQFSTTLKFSGELVTTALMQDMHLDHAEAEALKIKSGLAYDPNRPKYLKIVTDEVNGLLQEIRSAFSFYSEHFKNANPITHITMCGGMSNWIKLDSFIAQKLKISARPGNAWKNLFCPDNKNVDRKKGPSLASAIGLALRAAQNPLQSRSV